MLQACMKRLQISYASRSFLLHHCSSCAGGHHMCRSSQHQDWPAYSSPTYVPQQTHDQRQGLLHTASLHAKAAAAASQECIQHAIRMAKGVQTHEHGPVRNPGVNVPAGMVKVTLHDVELMTSSLCFCVIKIGPHWGRTTTLMAAPMGSWDWEVGAHHSCMLMSCPIIEVVTHKLCCHLHKCKHFIPFNSHRLHLQCSIQCLYHVSAVCVSTN